MLFRSYKEEVREALMLVDNNILKLDTVDMDYIKKLDRPQQPNMRPYRAGR